ncbi:MAG: flagellar hook-basal body protein [bacterium]|nr:flagellar hook-basal body protein [bacterium]
MINGLYSGASAMDVLSQQQEVIADNLMHVNTSGHRRKQATLVQKFVLDNQHASQDLGPELENLSVDFKPGRRVQTGRPLDVAVASDGFLVFENQEAGKEYLSRNGRLYRDPSSLQLVNDEGFPIQGENGPITIDVQVADQSITIMPDGTVSAEGRRIDRIRTVAFEDNQTLIPVGAAGFLRGEESVEAGFSVQLEQGFHELSNVQPVTELVSLIVNSRQFEANQRAMRSVSDALRDYIRS